MAGRGLTTPRGVDLADEGSGSPAGVSGNDIIDAGTDVDVVFAQRGNDTVTLGDGADYGEGGPGTDARHGRRPGRRRRRWLLHPGVRCRRRPRSASPTLATPSPATPVEDVVLGDNGSLTRPAATRADSRPRCWPQPGHHPARGQALRPRATRPTAGTSGADTITGDADNDVLLGQGGADARRRRYRRPTTPRAARAPTSCAAATATTTSSAAPSPAARRRRTGEVGQPDAADNVRGRHRFGPPPRRQRPAHPAHRRSARLAHQPGQRDPDRARARPRRHAPRPRRSGAGDGDRQDTPRVTPSPAAPVWTSSSARTATTASAAVATTTTSRATAAPTCSTATSR